MGTRHCLAELRAYRPEVLVAAFTEFQAIKSCELEAEGAARRRGALLVRHALSAEVLAELQGYAHDVLTKFSKGEETVLSHEMCAPLASNRSCCTSTLLVPTLSSCLDHPR